MSSLKMCDRKTEIEAAGKRDDTAGGNLPEGVSMTAYDVFPGITVIYNDIRAERFSGRRYESGSIFEINHCRKGRIEYELAEGEGDEFRYLAPGDLSISCRNDFREEAYFPLHYYQGITILIDTGQTPGCLSCFLDDVEVHPELLMKKFDNNGRGYITRSNESIEHIFSELCSRSRGNKKGISQGEDFGASAFFKRNGAGGCGGNQNGIGSPCQTCKGYMQISYRENGQKGYSGYACRNFPCVCNSDKKLFQRRIRCIFILIHTDTEDGKGSCNAERNRHAGN